MNFDFTDEQQQLRDMLQGFLADRAGFEARNAASRSELGWRPEMWSAFATEIGILGVGLPERVGGYGGATETMIVMEQLGEALVLEPFLETVVLGGALLTEAGGAEADEELERIVAGQSVLAFAWQERTSRYGFSDITTSASPYGEGWRLNGRKTVVVGAPWASRLIVTARTGGAAGEREGVSLFLLDRDAAGVELRDYRTIDGRRAADVSLHDVMLTHAALLGEVGRALPIVEKAVDIAIAALCAEAVGVMTRVLSDTVDYTKQRRQFNQPLASFQVLQHRMADMFMQVQMASSAMYLATLGLEADATARAKAVSSAKVTVGRACRFVGQSAVQLHGGMGVTDELAMTHYFRRLAIIEAEFGDIDHHLMRHARLSHDEAVGGNHPN